MDDTPNRMKAWLGAAVVIAALASIYWLISKFGIIGIIEDTAAFRAQVAELGVIGPLAIIGAMCIAVVFSPLPSAPIALAAGALYGHGWGTVYIVVGAQAGAMAAFLIARMLGAKLLHHWFGERLTMGLMGSQRTLMVIVFLSRLAPFVSFDLISYAAGLTPLHFWRFAIATVAGIIPMSFFLAHFGAELASGDSAVIGVTLLGLGLLTLLPVAWRSLKGHR